jgi:hypothetical protein
MRPRKFQASSRIGFGIDDESARMADFEAVRGTYEEQTFVQQIEQHIENKEALYLRMKELISQLQ